MGTTPMQVREHVNLAEYSLLERRRNMAVRHNRPITGGDLPAVAEPLPQNSYVVGCSDSRHEPNRAGILSLKDLIERPRKGTIVVALTYAITVNVITLCARVELNAMFAHCRAQILIA
jgi:hypothetical protein